YALGDVVQNLRALAEELDMPPEYSTTVSGRARELEIFLGEFGLALLIAVLFMYMVLAAQFESLGQPLLILMALPLSLPFALLSLWLGDQTLNLYSVLGLLVLF